MATNQNPGQNPIDPRDLRSVFRDIIRDQEDLSGVIRDILKDLSKTETAYKNIEARIDRISRGAVDIKGVQKELNKLVDREFITRKADEEIKKRARPQSKQLLEDAKQASLIAQQQAIAAGKTFDIEKNTLEILQAFEDHEALELFYTEQALQLAEERRKKGEEQLKLERGVSKQMGISGNLMSMFAKKIGFGEDAYDAMSKKARKLVEEQKDMGWWEKRMSRFLGGFKVLGTGIASIGSSLFNSLSDPLVLIGAGGLLLKGLKSAFDYIIGIQDQTVKFARAMNLSTGEARKIKMEFASLSVSSGDLFINSQKMVESQMEFTDTLGVTNMLSKEILATNIKLKDIAGLEAETRASIATSATITGKSAEDTTKAVLSQVAGLKQTTGIGFQYQKILGEASRLGGVLGLQFAKYPEKLTKALVTTKAMGLELSKLDSMAESFLDFESSISKEFEAQLLTGKEINLAKAREAFLNNDLVTAASEITKQVGNSGEFLKLNRIQQDSIAAAMGMSRDEMANMLKQQELLSKLGAKDLKDAQAKVQALKAEGKTREEISAIISEDAYQSLINASAQEKIAAFVDKIKQSFADFVETSGIIEKIESFVEYLSKPENIRAIIEGMRNFFANTVEFVGKAAYYILEALDVVAFGQIPDAFIDSIKSGAENMGAQIRSLGGDLSGIGVGGNAAQAAASSGGGSYSSTPPSNAILPTGRERDLNINIQVVDTPTSMKKRVDGYGYFEQTVTH